ncbi:MAG: ATP-binding protein [Deferribacterales bacterium]|jgi:signal transduction histidine kinase
MKRKLPDGRILNLQVKISILIFVIMMAFSFAIGHKMNNDVKRETYQITSNYIQSIPYLVNSAMYNFMLNGDRQSIKRLVLQLQNDSNIMGVHVFNKNWELTKALPELLNIYDKSYIDTIVKNKVDNGFRENDFDGRRVMSFYSPIANSPECRICHLKSEGEILGHININIDLTYLSDILGQDAANVRKIIMFMGVMLFVIVVILVNILITRPLHKLEKAMQEVANNNLEVRMDVESEDEFGRMSRLFNYMVYSLRKSFSTISSIHKNMMHNDRLMTIGTLTAAVSHEIKNPLNSIMLHSDILAMKCGEHKEYCEKILSDADRIKDIIDNTLNFSRFDDEQNVKEVNLNSFIADVRLYADRTILKWTDIPLVMDIQDELGTLRANPVHLEQILLNLIRNAVDAVEESESPMMWLRAGRDHENVVISVSDNGKGIPEHIKKLIFDEFYTTKATGTGIGLYIVKELVSKYNGTIDLTSEPGHGTTFTITLPVMKA